MALYLISGTAGTGKSLVCQTLKSHGFEAYDIDDDGLARWRHNQSNYIHPKSSVKANMRTSEFLKNHSWVVPLETIEQFTSMATNKNIFICGSISNEDELIDQFSAVFALHVADDILARRLKTRTGNDWGKQPHELQQSLKHHHKYYVKFKHPKTFVIDSNQPIQIVVSDIIDKVNNLTIKQ